MPGINTFGQGYAKKDIDNNIDDNGDYVVQVPSNVLYIIGPVILLLLLVNIAFLTYYNCCKSSTRKEREKYSKVSQIVSSDDDMANLKEYPI